MPEARDNPVFWKFRVGENFFTWNLPLHTFILNSHLGLNGGKTCGISEEPAVKLFLQVMVT